jgi:hypothetical protein
VLGALALVLSEMGDATLLDSSATSPADRAAGTLYGERRAPVGAVGAVAATI